MRNFSPVAYGTTTIELERERIFLFSCKSRFALGNPRWALKANETNINNWINTVFPPVKCSVCFHSWFARCEYLLRFSVTGWSADSSQILFRIIVIKYTHVYRIKRGRPLKGPWNEILKRTLYIFISFVSHSRYIYVYDRSDFYSDGTRIFSDVTWQKFDTIICAECTDYLRDWYLFRGCVRIPLCLLYQNQPSVTFHRR